MRPEFSIIIPVFNEKDSLDCLYREIKHSLITHEGKYEIVFINDGSQDGSQDVLDRLAALDALVSVFSSSFNQGQHKALEKGFLKARGKIIITLDADLQNDPCDIPLLLNKINEGFDLVCGWRDLRIDSWHKILKSKIGNFIQRKITKIKLHDMSCSLRAYKRNIVQGLFLNEKHEVGFIPYLLSQRTNKIIEVKINHRKRSFGKAKYPFFSTSFGVSIYYIRLIILNLTKRRVTNKPAKKD